MDVRQALISSPRKLQFYKLIGLGVLVIILVLLPILIKNPYYIGLLILIGINAMLALTFNMMFKTGLLSLGIAAFWCIGAYTSAVLVMKMHLSFWAALPAATVITGIIALLVGFLFVRNAGFTFVMLTAVLGMLIVVLFGNISYLGGYIGIASIPPPNPINIPFANPIEFISKVPFYYLMLILLAIVVLVYYALYSTWIGRAWMAVGLNPNLAASNGVNVFRYRLIAFVIASATAGLVGSFYAHYIGAMVPNSFNVYKTIYVHIYAILGGLDFAIGGPLVGAIIMTIVPESLRFAQTIEPIITGLLLIVIVLFLPGGLLSLVNGREAFLNPIERIRQISLWIKSKSSGIGLRKS